MLNIEHFVHIIDFLPKSPFHDFVHDLFDWNAAVLPVQDTPRYITGGVSGSDDSAGAYAEEHFVSFLEEIRAMKEELGSLSLDINALEERLEVYADDTKISYTRLSGSEIQDLKAKLGSLEGKVIELHQLLSEAEMDVVNNRDREALGETLRGYNEKDTLGNSHLLVNSFMKQYLSIEETMRIASMREV